MISCEKYVRIIIGDITSLFCQRFLLSETGMEKKNPVDVIIFFSSLIIIIIIIIISIGNHMISSAIWNK